MAQDRRFPNRWSRYILLSVRDAVGMERFHSLMSVARLTHFVEAMPADDFEEEGLAPREVGRLFEALEEIYGTQTGREQARLAGRESFRLWRKGLGSVAGLMDSTLPLLSDTFRMRLGMETVAEIFTRYLGQPVTLDENGDQFFIALNGCGFCAGRWSQEPICWFMVGFLEALSEWVLGGKGSAGGVEELQCMAQGAPTCTFAIAKPARRKGRA